MKHLIGLIDYWGIVEKLESVWLNYRVDKMIKDMEIANANIREANAINNRVLDRAGIILKEMKYNPDHRKAE